MIKLPKKLDFRTLYKLKAKFDAGKMTEKEKSDFLSYTLVVFEHLKSTHDQIIKRVKVENSSTPNTSVCKDKK